MKKVLIVEDHADIRKLLRMTMEFDDFDIYEASSGDIGWVEAQRLKPDVVLLDLMMPGAMDGLQVCRKIKSDPTLHNTRVVILTARGQAQDREAGHEAGADAYLIKPFSTLQVLDTLYRLCGQGA
ncbi:response regulator [uncultured Rhodoferax sp.]|uniref:response regulator transcription factor n=1 Tax=uncultured Rhodoferax sp. TaxID=223188 RepID=UPI0025EC6D5E|nr:response regulator [uncultured Rhodoferax sp.]